MMPQCRNTVAGPAPGAAARPLRKLPLPWPLALLLTLVLAGLCVTAAAAPTAGVIPSVPLVKLDGSAANLDDWGGKPLVVNIWATWCPPCREEMPSLQRLSELLAPSGIGVVALSLDDDHNLVREFALKYAIKLPVGIAASPGSAGAALGAAALPLTLYVGADGRILGRHLGPRDWADERVVRELKAKLLVPQPAR